MPVVVIEEATDLSGLTGRLLRRNSSADTVTAAERALRRANPGVDLDDLRPGTVVVVPQLHGGLSRIGDVVDPVVEDATAPVARDLAALTDAFAAATRRTHEARTRALGALEDDAVKAALAEDDAAAQLATRLRAHLTASEEVEQRRQEAADAADAVWADGLAQLRALQEGD